MSYTPTIWENGKKPAINATNLNKIENELAKLDNIVSMSDITEITETTMPNSYDGRLLVKEIGGKCVQGENPSLTNTQEIKKSVVSEIKTHGKNFFAKDDSTKGYYSPEGVLSSSTVWFIQRLDARNIDKIVMSGITKFGTAVVAETENGIVVIGNNGNSVYNVSSYDTIIYSVHNDDFGTAQVEVGSDATPYEPYTESVITLSQPIELYGIGDVQDAIEGDKVVRKFGELNFADFTWTREEAYNLWISSGFSKAKNDTWLMCETVPYARCTTGNAVIGTRVNRPYNIWVRNGSTEITPSGKAIYELAEPTTEELPIADQIALNSLSTYDGITYLEFDSEIEPTFKGEYGTSKVGCYILEGMLAGVNGELLGKSNSERINALETSVVNNI